MNGPHVDANNVWSAFRLENFMHCIVLNKVVVLFLVAGETAAVIEGNGRSWKTLLVALIDPNVIYLNSCRLKRQVEQDKLVP